MLHIYDKMTPMKFNVLLSILFAIVTSFAAIHEVKHIQHNDAASCLICTVNHNLVSGDAIKLASDVEIFQFEAVTYNSHFAYLHVKTNSNQTRAPPLLS